MTYILFPDARAALSFATAEEADRYIERTLKPAPEIRYEVSSKQPLGWPIKAV